MNRDEAKENAKRKLKDYISTKRGVNTDKLFRCLNKDHEDRKPSMGYDEKRNKIKCFSCGIDWDVFDLIRNEYGLTNDKAVFDKTYEVLRIDIDQSPTAYTSSGFAFEDLTKQPSSADNEVVDIATSGGEGSTVAQRKEEMNIFFLKAQSNINDPKCIDYLRKRGINIETAKRHGLGFIQDWQSSKALAEGKNPPATPRVIIPTSDVSYFARDIIEPDPQKGKANEGVVHVFNAAALDNESPCFVVEGGFDALSFLEIGYNAVALGGISNIASFAAKIKALPHCCPLILAFDNDKAGKDAAEKLSVLLNKNGIKYDTFDTAGYKDPNEFLCKDREKFKQKVQESIINFNDKLSDDAQSEADEFDVGKSAYPQTSISNHIDKLRESRKEMKTFLSTGFPKLDEVLGGGLYDGLYIIGAISSLGKTTFVIQVADHLASQGHDVLFFSLEMSKYEIMAKSISRHTYLYCYERGIPTYLSKDTRQIITGKNYINSVSVEFTSEDCAMVYCAEEDYRKYANKLFIHEGVGEIEGVDEIGVGRIGVAHIRKAIEGHIKYTGKTPVIVDDYLQILAAVDTRATDKRNTDTAVSELRTIIRDFKTPIIGVSSLNRQSYKDKIGMAAFKESGAIEYSSDVLIGLQLKGAGEENFNVDKAKMGKETESGQERQIELKVLKNRSGQTGNSIEFKYHPRENMFEEIGIMKL